MMPPSNPLPRIDLERFVLAQDKCLDAVMCELRQGRKTSHWIWYVFPQLAALGRSATAKYYGLTGRQEALAYSRHPVLGGRLHECVELVLAAVPRTSHEIFGSPDDLKFHSCITLFEAVSDSPGVFRSALATFYDGRRDRATLDLMDAKG